jgi:hypothetical protein
VPPVPPVPPGLVLVVVHPVVVVAAVSVLPAAQLTAAAPQVIMVMTIAWRERMAVASSVREGRISQQGA